MLTMHTVGIMLRMIGFDWDTWEKRYYVVLHIPLDCIKIFKIYWWPPPEAVSKQKMSRKKLLLTSLAIASAKASTAAPPIEFRSQQVTSYIRKATKNGMLMTARLSPEGAYHIRESLESMPASLFTPNDSKYVIVDTGASTCATSEKSDFVTGTLQELSQPFALDGIAGSIKGKHLGKCRYEVLADDGSIAVMETNAYYAPGMNSTLFSPQHYFLQQHTNGYKNYKMTVDHNKSILHLGSKTVTNQHDPTF